MSDPDYAKIGRKISKLKSHFAMHERYSVLEREFLICLHRRKAELEQGIVAEARAIAVIGASGSGKTTAVDRLISKCPDLVLEQEGQIRADVISFRIPSPATLKDVGCVALYALGFDLKSERTAGYIWRIVKRHLSQREVLFLHLDEAQDLYKQGKPREMQAVVNTLKSLMQAKEWPVGLILSGTPELKDMINFDPQLARRVIPIEFGKIPHDGNHDNIRDLIAAYAHKAKLAVTQELCVPAFSSRLVHSADGQFGLIIEITISAIEAALLQSSIELKTSHFIEAFRRRSGSVDGVNPFVIDDYLTVDTRKLLGRVEYDI